MSTYFDACDNNLILSKYMYSMHKDMNGSSTARGIVHAATENKLIIKIKCWLKIVQNHIGPKSYKQNNMVKALNRNAIEIIHADAEEQMVIADRLKLVTNINMNRL